jgi:hypothetical protein
MAFQNLCPPALIYLIFSITQVVIDTVKGLYNTALIKVWVAFIFTILLNYLCQLGLGIISWFIVFIPFLLMTLVVAILLLMFGLDPATGKLKVSDPKNKQDHKHHKHGHSYDNTHGHHPPPARDDKKIKEEDPVMKYFDSAETGGGGGSTTDVKEDETKKEKSDRILSKSLLFYSEEESSSPETKVKKDEKHLDTTKYQLFVDSVSSILSGMGESEMASDLQTKSNACINSAKKMDKDEAKISIKQCFDELMGAVYNKFTPPKAAQLKQNIREMNCKDGEPNASCRKRIEDGWWN